MNCSEFENKISLYIDGELPVEEAEATARHLETCAHCNKVVQEYKSIDGLISGIPNFTAPEKKAPGLIGKKAVKRETFPRLFFPRLALAGAFIAILLVLGFNIIGDIFFTPSPSKPAPVATAGKPVVKDELIRISYDIELNEADYNISVEGEEVELVSVELSENDTHYISMDFSGD